MSKGLEAFYIPTINGLEKVVRYCDVEKELKEGEKAKQALEIIKNKCRFFYVEEENGRYRVYDNELYKYNELTQEEYNLLKEVLL